MSAKKTTTINKPGFLERVLEIIPGLTAWIVLTSPIWLSLQLPIAMAFIIFFLDIYWLYRVGKTVILSMMGYRRMEAAKKTDWMSKLEKDYSGYWRKLKHIFIIPSYKERGYVIETTLKAISESNFPAENIGVVLALEERDDSGVLKEKYEVADRYRDRIGKIYVTEHPDGIEGEVIGPGSNRTWSLKHLMPQLEKDFDIDNTILTTLDADFAIHENLLAALTYKYLSTEHPEHKTYTGVFFYSNNYWQAPTPMRVISLSLSVGQLAELVENWKYVTFSSHSLNLRTLIELDFWTIDHVNDDSHFYWKAFYHFKGDFEVVPHWMPIYTDTVLDENLKKTIVNQYKQLQRWAYGAEHMPYIFRKSFTEKKVPFFWRMERLFYIIRAYLFWATIAFLTGFGALIALFVNPVFRETVLGQNLAIYSSYILTVAILGLLPMFYYGKKLTPPMPEGWGNWKRFWGRVQYIVAPLVLMTFGAIPALDAQTRLMLGKYMSFRVTRKHRKVEGGS